MNASGSRGGGRGIVEVRAMRPGDLDAAVDVLARGFAEEPGNLALLPDPKTRAEVLQTGTRLQLGCMMPLGSVHVAMIDGALGGVAIWHPPGRSVASTRSLGRALLHAAPALPSLLRPLPHKATVVLRHAPETVPLVLARRRAVARASAGLSWHLAFLATAPEYRGRGLARRLLDRQLARCDEDGASAWLETTDPVNPPLYERFGFSTIGHVAAAAWLPGLWVMHREAATDRTAEPASPDRP